MDCNFITQQRSFLSVRPTPIELTNSQPSIKPPPITLDRNKIVAGREHFQPTQTLNKSTSQVSRTEMDPSRSKQAESISSSNSSMGHALTKQVPNQRFSQESVKSPLLVCEIKSSAPSQPSSRVSNQTVSQSSRNKDDLSKHSPQTQKAESDQNDSSILTSQIQSKRNQDPNQMPSEAGCSVNALAMASQQACQVKSRNNSANGQTSQSFSQVSASNRLTATTNIQKTDQDQNWNPSESESSATGRACSQPVKVERHKPVARQTPSQSNPAPNKLNSSSGIQGVPQSNKSNSLVSSMGQTISGSKRLAGSISDSKSNLGQDDEKHQAPNPGKVGQAPSQSPSQVSILTSSHLKISSSKPTLPGKTSSNQTSYAKNQLKSTIHNSANFCWLITSLGLLAQGVIANLCQPFGSGPWTSVLDLIQKLRTGQDLARPSQEISSQLAAIGTMMFGISGGTRQQCAGQALQLCMSGIHEDPLLSKLMSSAVSRTSTQVSCNHCRSKGRIERVETCVVTLYNQDNRDAQLVDLITNQVDDCPEWQCEICCLRGGTKITKYLKLADELVLIVSKGATYKIGTTERSTAKVHLDSSVIQIIEHGAIETAVTFQVVGFIHHFSKTSELSRGHYELAALSSRGDVRVFDNDGRARETDYEYVKKNSEYLVVVHLKALSRVHMPFGTHSPAFLPFIF